MQRLLKAALCCCVVLTLTGSVLGQQKREMTDSQKVRRLDISPEPAPTRHPKVYTGTSFRSLRIPEVTYGYVSANGRNFFYNKVGHGDENIVVIHGGPGLPHNYLLPALQNLSQEATVWFFDARGHGLSEQNYQNEPYTMKQLVDDIGSFTTAAGLQNYTLFGHSFGGMVALQYATTNPQGLRRLILSDTAPSVAYTKDFQERLKKVMPSSLYDKYEKSQSDQSVPADQRLRNTLRIVYPYYWYNAPKDYYMDQDINSLNLNSLAADQIWGSDGMSYDVTSQLKDIDVPTLVIVGRYDIVVGIDPAKTIVDEIPNAQLVILDHSGHYPFFEENHLFTQWVKTFLRYYAS